MNLIELAKYLLDEAAAEEYLLNKNILKNYTECPYCNSKSIGKIRRGLLKCYKCKREWNRRKGSFLESRHIASSKFIGFLKLYSEEMGVMEICSELEIERKHGLTIFNDTREILLRDKLDYNNKSEKVLLWADKEDKLHIRFIEDECVPPDVKGYLELSFSRYKEFGGLYGFLVKSEWRGIKIRYGNLVNSFISYVKMKVISYRGIHKRYFYEYLVELLIRFNLRDKDFYEVLLENLEFSRVVKTPLSRKSKKKGR
ncbi:MAG: hypothetical protein ACM3U0_01255 [archaeon]